MKYKSEENHPDYSVIKFAKNVPKTSEKPEETCHTVNDHHLTLVWKTQKNWNNKYVASTFADSFVYIKL